MIANIVTKYAIVEIPTIAKDVLIALNPKNDNRMEQRSIRLWIIMKI
jgi:hypothetical protein